MLGFWVTHAGVFVGSRSCGTRLQVCGVAYASDHIKPNPIARTVESDAEFEQLGLRDVWPRGPAPAILGTEASTALPREMCALPALTTAAALCTHQTVYRRPGLF